MRRMHAFTTFLLCCLMTTASVALAAQDEEPSDATEPALSVEEILKRDPSSSDYGEAPRCLQTRLIRSTEVLDERHVVFEVRRDEFFLVQFEHRCPGLRRNQPIMTEPTAGRLCQLDGIRPLYDHGLGGYQPGMRCAIPGFVSVTKEQIVQLKDALKAERRKKRAAD